MTPDPTVELLRRFFAAVSFDEGGRPAYADLRELFLETGKLISTSGPAPDIAGVDQFIASRRPAVESGELAWFQETEIDGATSSFGNIAHRFSHYSKAGRRAGEDFHAQGMISTQFVRTPSGWRISVMAWDDERPGLAIGDGGQRL